MPTQVMRSQEDYLDNNASKDIGRRLNENQHELFVVCDPAEAMLQQFQHTKPDFIALHDIGTDASQRLLVGLANATRGKVQRLTIRRQGYGMALATIDFAELPGSNGQTLRVYSTHVDADMAQRQLLARALLAYSRLGVVMLGDLPPHAITSALDPLREGIATGPWPNRHLLMVPMGSASAVTSLVAPLADHGHLGIRSTPHAATPSQAWTFISTAWNRLRAGLPVDPPAPVTRPARPDFAATGQGSFQSTGQGGLTATGHGDFDSTTPAALGQLASITPPIAQAPVAAAAAAVAPATAQSPLPMQPMPALPSRTPPAAETPWQRYTRACSDIKGMVSCCVFELSSQRSLAHAGARPGPASLASQGATLLASMNDAGRSLGLGGGQPEAVITLHGHLLVLHPIAGHAGLWLHAVLDRSAANLAQARVQMNRLDAQLDPDTPRT